MSLKATDFLFTPRDFIILLKSMFKMDIYGWVKMIVLLVTFYAARNYGVGFIDTLFLTFFLATFLYNLSSKIAVTLALAALGLIMVIIILGPHTEFLNETTWPEPIAVWVFYFLAIGVLKQVKDVMSERGATDDEEQTEQKKIEVEEVEEHIEKIERRKSKPVVKLTAEQIAKEKAEESVSTAEPSYNGAYIVVRQGTRLIIKTKK